MARKRGRKTKLTPVLQQYIVRAISAGATRRHACQCVGIDHSTFYDWLRRAAAGDKRYMQFSHAIKRAEGTAVVRAMQQIEQAAKTDWRAAAWKLERCYPDEYGKRRVIKQKHAGAVQHGHIWIERLQKAHAKGPQPLSEPL